MRAYLEPTPVGAWGKNETHVESSTQVITLKNFHPKAYVEDYAVEVSDVTDYLAVAEQVARSEFRHNPTQTFMSNNWFVNYTDFSGGNSVG